MNRASFLFQACCCFHFALNDVVENCNGPSQKSSNTDFC
ncbi:unnamed protein product [Linum tenue]|uniref:Uncharacterized protein n=1 Tax=Linum tenue TaxID=586396 RepID=A0AAV0M8D4_9ROSI|nr:unnamed protein product [Linum tenue]